MPHRNRTLMKVVILIWIVVLAATLVNAAVRSGGGAEQGQEERDSSALPPVEAPMAPAANLLSSFDHQAPAGSLS